MDFYFYFSLSLGLSPIGHLGQGWAGPFGPVDRWVRPDLVTPTLSPGRHLWLAREHAAMAVAVDETPAGSGLLGRRRGCQTTRHVLLRQPTTAI